jgi:alpha-tubulin suppressor-like RCC1 family protein
MVGATGVTKIATGTSRTCVLTTSGSVQCTGVNPGDGSSQVATLTTVSGLSPGATALGSGFYVTWAATAGAVRCWGEGGKGTLGDGTTVDRQQPVDVVGLSSGVTAVVAGAEFTCALMSTGSVKCWGTNTLCNLGAHCDGTVPLAVP